MNKTFAMLIPLALIVFVMYFLMIRPQRKKDKEVKEMRSSLNAGDEIVTIGGFTGKIVKVKEESVIVTLGADKTRLEIMEWGISKVTNPAGGRPIPGEKKEDKSAMPKRMKKKSAEEKKEEAKKADDAKKAAQTKKDEAAAKAKAEKEAQKEAPKTEAVPETEDAKEAENK